MCTYLQSLKMPEFCTGVVYCLQRMGKYIQHSTKVVLNGYIRISPCIFQGVCLFLDLQPTPADTTVAPHVNSYNIALALGLEIKCGHR